jgi:hypothetical protein
MSPKFVRISLPPDVLAPPPASLDVDGFQPLFDSLPGGDRTFWGVPFSFPQQDAGRRWLWIGPGAGERVTVPIRGAATSIVVAHFAIAPPSPRYGSRVLDRMRDRMLGAGEVVADYVLVHNDGSEHRVPIRRGIEIGNLPAGDLAFAARTHDQFRELDWRGPHEVGQWGEYQQGVAAVWVIDWRSFDPVRRPVPQYWLYALENPRPGSPVAEILFEPRGTTALAIAGVTLFAGVGHPLRHGKLETIRVTPGGVDPDPAVTVDLGIVARRYRATPIARGDGERESSAWGTPLPDAADRDLLVDLSAADGATITVGDVSVELADVRAGRSVAGPRIELLTPERQWVSVTVLDGSTQAPTPARVSLRAADGRYLPPYGHRHEVNTGWFEDYGADLRLGGSQFAYVDGRFDIELPIGEVFVDAVKGFEFAPLQTVLDVQPGERMLTLCLDRAMDWRARGWISADTHVHFLSPQTAWLEAHAEGVNIVNLLASQWGDLFTNVADFTGDQSGVSREDTLIWVGTENRQHMLGHLSLLGIRAPVNPMCAAGPGESYIGDPVWTSVADWADRCRKQDGVVISPHFPGPYCEVVADVVLGKIDGLEVRDFGSGVDSYGVGEWYRLLNCGYRVAAVGGTDKMSATMPVGGVRTYAAIDTADLTFATWAAAVRAGRTVTSSGPLIELRVEGRSIGDDIALPTGGGTLSVEAQASSVQPITALELVHDGRVVERVEEPAGTERLRISTRVQAGGPGWIAARCEGPGIAWHEWPVRTAAHTSPVYLSGPGTRRDDAADRLFLTTIIDGGLAWLDTLAIPADAQRHARIRNVFQEARARLTSGG